jgi:hypothetical protein
LVEQLTLNQRVQGSSPCAPTIEIKDLRTIDGGGLDRYWLAVSEIFLTRLRSRVPGPHRRDTMVDGSSGDAIDPYDF